MCLFWILSNKLDLNQETRVIIVSKSKTSFWLGTSLIRVITISEFELAQVHTYNGKLVHIDKIYWKANLTPWWQGLVSFRLMLEYMLKPIFQKVNDIFGDAMLLPINSFRNILIKITWLKLLKINFVSYF